MSAHGAVSGTVGLDSVATLPRPHPLLATPRRVLGMRSDAALVERFRAGDQEAFAVLYERHRASVLAVCIGVLGSRHDAEDAAQDAFASLSVALRSTPPRDLRPWLARVARNAAIDVIRRRRAVTTADDNLESQAPASTEVRAEWGLVLEGLRELPESQRTALLMRELGGHSYQEIGDLLELDAAAVRGLIARGRIGLRAHREATEMPCAAAREALATEPDGRQRDRTVRRHLRTCSSCKAYGRGLRRDAHSLRTIVPAPIGGFVAGGGAIFGSFAAKTVLTGGVLTQVTAACAASVCAVGGIALLDPHALGHHEAHHAAAAPAIVRARETGAIQIRTASPPSQQTISRGTTGQPTTSARRSSTSAGPGAQIKRAPDSPTTITSAASVVLNHRFQLPGSEQAGTTTGASPTDGATPTSAPSIYLPRPVHLPGWAGTSTGSSPTAWTSVPTNPRTGFGSHTGGTESYGTGTGTTGGTGTGTGTGTEPSGATSTGTGTTSGTATGTGTGTEPSGATSTGTGTSSSSSTSSSGSGSSDPSPGPHS